MFKKRRILLSGGIILILLFSGGVKVFSSIGVQVDLGFEGYYPVDKWVPLHILFTNEGPLVKGNLLVKWKKNKSLSLKPTEVSYLIPLSLPPSSKKLYTTTLLLESGVSSLQLLLLAEDRIIFKKEIPLKPLYMKEGLILVVNKKGSGFDFLNQFSDEKKRRVFYIKMENLPRQWIGYDGVDVLIIDEVSSLNLEDTQKEALKRWLSVGGTLIITARGDYGKFTSSFLFELLPIEITGKVVLNPPFSFSKENFKGSLEKLEVWKIYSSQGEVKIREKGIPLLIKFKKGGGQIFFLATDFFSSPFRDWPGRWKLWEEMIEKKSLPSIPRGMLNGIMEPLFLLEKPSYPSRMKFLLFLSVYLLVLGIFYIFKKKSLPGGKRGKLIFFLIIFLFSFTSYYLFGRKIKQENTFLKEISIYYKSGESPQARVESYFLLFSSQEDSFKLKTRAETSFVSTLPGKNEKIHRDLELLFDKGKVFFTFFSKPWSFYSFRTETILEFPLYGKVEKEGSFKISLRNLNLFPLEDILIIYKEKYLFFKKLPSLSEREFTFNSERGKDARISSLEESKREILNQIFNHKKIKEISFKNPLLVGWFRKFPSPIVEVKGGINQKFTGLILMVLKII